jgi:hypothetical protein
VSRTVSILALSLFVLGLAVGPMIAAPISETYGRSVVYKVSAITYMLFILGAGFSNSLASLLVCRFFAGTLGGPVLAVGAGTNADMYAAKDRAIASSFFIMMPVSNVMCHFMRYTTDMILVPWTFFGSCDRWIRRAIQRLALDPVVHHLHRVGNHSPGHVHVRDLQEDHPGPTSETSQHSTTSGNRSERPSAHEDALDSDFVATTTHVVHRTDRAPPELIHGFHLLGPFRLLRGVSIHFHDSVWIQYVAIRLDFHCHRPRRSPCCSHSCSGRPTLLCQTSSACA